MIRHFAFAAVALISLTTTVRADDAAHEAVWKRYWMAIDTQKTCNNVDFSQAQYDALVHVINERIQFDLGAGRRTQLMSDASSEVYDLTFKYGCGGEGAQNLLALYDRDLAPAVE